MIVWMIGNSETGEYLDCHDYWGPLDTGHIYRDKGAAQRSIEEMDDDEIARAYLAEFRLERKRDKPPPTPVPSAGRKR